MPGLYLAALLVSFAGVVALDLRFGLALRARPRRTALVTMIGVAVFVVWDLVGITTGVFVRGDGPWYIGVELAPHLPVEEIVFLAFLSYLTCVIDGAVGRIRRRENAA